MATQDVRQRLQVNRMAKAMPKEVKQFIIEHYCDMTAKALTEALLEKFDYHVSVGSLRTFASRNGIVKYPNFTEEQERWLKDNASKYRNSYPLTNAFNEVFGTNQKPKNIIRKIYRLMPNFHFGWSGGCKKGEGSSITAKPIGTEVFKGGYWWVKVNDIPLPKDYKSNDRMKNWKQKHRLVWEHVHGEIPKGYMVTFLDGDTNNCDIDNLYLIPRKIQTTMVRNNWYSSNRELTLAEIKWCELFYKIKEARERK